MENVNYPILTIEGIWENKQNNEIIKISKVGEVEIGGYEICYNYKNENFDNYDEGVSIPLNYGNEFSILHSKKFSTEPTLKLINENTIFIGNVKFSRKEL